jgi:hypothetical protein
VDFLWLGGEVIKVMLVHINIINDKIAHHLQESQI